MLRTRRQVIEIPCGRRGWGVGVENRHPTPQKRICIRVAKKITAVAVHAANAASDRDSVWTTWVGERNRKSVEPSPAKKNWLQRSSKFPGREGKLASQEQCSKFPGRKQLIRNNDRNFKENLRVQNSLLNFQVRLQLKKGSSLPTS